MRSYTDRTKARIRSIIGESRQKKVTQKRTAFERAARVTSQEEVIIIGAGIAGLCAAYELERKGYRVTILEAEKTHVGGRVRTFRREGNYSEFGAMRIPIDHDLTLGYISDFGLATRRFIQDNENTYAYIRGQRVNRNESGKEELKARFNLNSNEQAMSADDIWLSTVVSVLESLSPSDKAALHDDDLKSIQLLQLDQKSLYNILKQGGLTRDAIEYVSSLYGVTTYLETGLLEHLREEKEGVWIGDFVEIEGGMDRLIYSFVDNIQTSIRQGAVVKKIRNSPSHASVTFAQNSQTHTLDADWVICTVPLGVLARIEIEHAFSKKKINAIRNINYDSSSKIISIATDRFWEKDDNIFGGGSIWDGGLGHTWYPSDNESHRDKAVSNSRSMLLSSYTWGMHSRRIDTIPEESINSYVISELSKIHCHSNNIVESYRWSWDNHEWSSGAFAFFNPGDHSDLHLELVTHEDRVLLAGEHCSLTHSWIQGALESALDVCNYILDYKCE